jgi:hypothetical protein
MGGVSSEVFLDHTMGRYAGQMATQSRETIPLNFEATKGWSPMKYGGDSREGGGEIQEYLGP